MSHQAKHALRLSRPRPRLPRMIAVLASAAVVAAGTMLVPADAGTTISPTEAGSPPVVRDGSVHVGIDVGAKTFYRSNASGSFAAQSAAAVLAGLTVCRGDLVSGTNNSPRDHLVVTDPNGATVLDETSPVRDVTIASFTTNPKNQPKTPQPSASNTNYRGDFPGTPGDGTYHGMGFDIALLGKPAGVYTVTTTTTNMVKTALTGACAVGSPNAAGTGVVGGPVVDVQQFEYRPWQVNFTDVFGKGGVNVNLTPKEFRFNVGAKVSAIFAGTANSQQFYALPGSGYPLPSDPQACVDDPSSCLPSNATQCDPGAGCTPRVMFLNHPFSGSDPVGIAGVFDLDTKAFIAQVKIDGTTRTMMSLGTANDAYYHGLLDQLSAGAAAKGVDLASILATEVRVSNSNQVLRVSLLNGLQIDPTTSHGGIQIASDGTAQAGVLLDIYSSLRLDGGACVTNTASSSTEPGRYTRNEDNGYNVTKSDLLPAVPGVGPLGALVGGPLYHITGKFSSSALVNTASAVIGVDTAADEPHGYPIWISPFLSPIHTSAPKTLDFLGTATWSASETPILQGCLVVDVMLGAGVAVYNNPLPIGLGTIFDPLAQPSPAAEQLTDAVNDAVNQVVGQVSSNPTVNSLLTQVTALLPL